MESLTFMYGNLLAILFVIANKRKLFSWQINQSPDESQIHYQSYILRRLIISMHECHYCYFTVLFGERFHFYERVIEF